MQQVVSLEESIHTAEETCRHHDMHWERPSSGQQRIHKCPAKDSVHRQNSNQVWPLKICICLQSERYAKCYSEAFVSFTFESSVNKRSQWADPYPDWRFCERWALKAMGSGEQASLGETRQLSREPSRKKWAPCGVHKMPVPSCDESGDPVPSELSHSSESWLNPRSSTSHWARCPLSSVCLPIRSSFRRVI